MDELAPENSQTSDYISKHSGKRGNVTFMGLFIRLQRQFIKTTSRSEQRNIFHANNGT